MNKYNNDYYVRQLSDLIIFRPGNLYIITGIIIMVFGIIVNLMFPQPYSHVVEARIFTFLPFGILGLFFLLTFIIARVKIDNEKITCINHFGKKESILWNEIEFAHEEPNHIAPYKIFLRIYGNKKEIKIRGYYVGVEKIIALINSRYPEILKKDYYIE